MKTLATLLAVLAMPPASSAAESAVQKTTITVKISNVPAAQGQVCVSLHKGRLNRPGSSNRNTRTQCTPAALEGVSFSFGDLEPGKYAISAFHDRNGDGRLNHRFTGPRRESLTYLGDDAVTLWNAKLGDLEKEYSGSENTVELSLHLRGGTAREAEKNLEGQH